MQVYLEVENYDVKLKMLFLCIYSTTPKSTTFQLIDHNEWLLEKCFQVFLSAKLLQSCLIMAFEDLLL